MENIQSIRIIRDCVLICTKVRRLVKGMTRQAYGNRLYIAREIIRQEMSNYLKIRTLHLVLF